MKRIIYTSRYFLLMALLLMFFSCRSSKKGTGKDKDVTQPTQTVVTGNKNVSGKQEQQKAKIAAGTNFTSKVRVTLKQENKEITTNGTLRMRYDDVIQITLVDPILGVAEVGRMELSPDNVLVIDRVNKRYVSTTYEEFTELKSRDIDFATIQDFFWQEAQNSDRMSYTVPTRKPIQLDLKLSSKGNQANWNAHTTVSDKYVKTDANKLFSSMIGQ